MIVVSNATPIISLASIGRIDILKHFFDKVYIPQAVYDEIKSKKAYGYKEIDDAFFQVESIKDEFAQNILLNDLDLGEALLVPIRPRWECIRETPISSMHYDGDRRNEGNNKLKRSKNAKRNHHKLPNKPQTRVPKKV